VKPKPPKPYYWEGKAWLTLDEKGARSWFPYTRLSAHPQEARSFRVLVTIESIRKRTRRKAK